MGEAHEQDGADEVERGQRAPSFLKLRGLSLLLTVGAIVVAVVALALIAVFPVVVDRLELGPSDAWVHHLAALLPLRWCVAA